MSLLKNEKKIEEPTKKEQEDVVEVKVDKSRTAVVRISPLNIRSTPDLVGNVIGKLLEGDSVKIVEDKDGWGRLEDGGWILLDYVS